MNNNPEFGKIRGVVFPIHKHELRKFIPLIAIFFIISFNYYVLRSLKDMYLLKPLGAEVIYFLKLFGVTPSVIIFTITYSKISKVADRDARFNIIIAYFLVFFGIFQAVLLPNLKVLQLDSLADGLNAMLPGMKNLWEAIRFWPLSLFYINAEAWGTMALSILFWTFANEIISLKQSKRIYSFLTLGASVGPLTAGIMLKHFKGNFDVALGTGIGLMALLLVIYNIFARDIKKHPALYQIEQKPKKKKEKLSFMDSLKFLAKSRYLALVSCLVISYGVVVSLFEAVWKAKVKEFTAGDGDMLANIYGNQGILTGVVAMLVIVFISAPIMNRGWRFAASTTPTVGIVATLGFFSFLYFQDSLSSITAIFGMTPLSLAVAFGLLNVVFIKSVKYTLFDATKEQTYIPLDEESKIRGKAAVDGVGSRLGKSLGSLLLTMLIVPIFGTITNAQYIIFFLIIFMLVLWLMVVKQLSVLFKQRAEESSATNK